MAHLKHGQTLLQEQERAGGTPWKWQGSRQDASHHLLLLLSVYLPFPAGTFIFIWLVVLYYPKMKETTGSLSHIVRHDKTNTVSQE